MREAALLVLMIGVGWYGYHAEMSSKYATLQAINPELAAEVWVGVQQETWWIDYVFAVSLALTSLVFALKFYAIFISSSGTDYVAVLQNKIRKSSEPASESVTQNSSLLLAALLIGVMLFVVYVMFAYGLVM